MAKELEGDERQAHWMQGPYKEFCNDKKDSSNVAGKHSEWKMTAEESQGLRFSVVQPIFWLTQIYNDNHDHEAHPDSIRTLKYGGELVRGLYVDDDGRPLLSAVIRINPFEQSKVNRSNLLEESTRQYHKDQAQSTWG